jgi:anaerobic selenocysteine-containing dehydrogenase
MNSAFQDAKATRKQHPTNPAYMNPDDLAAEGLVEGDLVEISSAHGRAVGAVAADTGVRRGVVSMSHTWGVLDVGSPVDAKRGAHTGRLVSLHENLQPFTYMPVQTGLPISVRRIDLLDRPRSIRPQR